MEDYRQSTAYSSYYTTKGWTIDKIGTTNILVKKIPILGSIIKIQRGTINTSLEDLEAYAENKNAIAMAIEPNITTEDAYYSTYEQLLETAGFKDFDMFFSPTKTTYIDLTKNTSEIYDRFERDIKKAITNSSNVDIKIATTYIELYGLLKNAGKTGKYYVQKYKDWLTQWKGFGKQIKILLAYKDDVLVGGNMFIVNKNNAVGLFLPTTDSGRNSKVAAALIWAAVKVAKEAGCEKFDLNGLYDDRYKAPYAWKGLSIFKKHFRGHELYYMHPKVKVFSNLLKPLEKMKLLWVFFMTG